MYLIEYLLNVFCVHDTQSSFNQILWPYALLSLAPN